MDVSDILAAHEAKKKAVTVEKDIPLEVDAGFLTVTDLNPVDAESYECVSQLPPPTTQLPRAKPLPKPKPPTKWEQFAKAKGIQKKRRDKKVWDEEKQEWVDRWGWKGANKDKEVQWATEVPANADIDHDPAKEARDARKARVAKNERQHQQNLTKAAQVHSVGGSSAAPLGDRKKIIDRTLAVTRSSTASMGKFNRQLEGEKKLKGVKRKFEPTEISATNEKAHNLAIMSRLDKEPSLKKAKRSSESSGDAVLNVRKAIRATSKGKGSAALARERSTSKGKKGKR
ncbi:RRS1-domain-containing protein [Fomes fomentarius]|nr:RRS1-domain-containing protein [Fomes fomentarius]